MKSRREKFPSPYNLQDGCLMESYEPLLQSKCNGGVGKQCP